VKVMTEFQFTNTRSPEENVIRSLYAFFLNTECIDDLLKFYDGKFNSAGAADVGLLVWNATKKIVRVKFLEWVQSDSLALFICSGSTGQAIAERFESKGYNENPTPEPFTTMTGQRFKDLTGFERKRMPKDMQKSFETKAFNAIPKFIEEYRKSPGEARSDDPPKGSSMEEWLDRALDPKDNFYIPYASLRPMHNLLVKCVRLGEDMTASIQRIKDHLAVARIMLS